MTNSPQTLTAYRADDFRVSAGVARGETLSFAGELVLDDVYQLAPQAELQTLRLESADAECGFGLGAGRGTLHLDSFATFMTPDGETHDAIIMVEVLEEEAVAIFLLPFSELKADIRYRLIGYDTQNVALHYAQAACGSFASGTLISMADGTLCPIEALSIGDRVLTRDAGPQPIRWIGHTTVRAFGAFAPVVIKKGVLHNENDLVLRPDHRVFVYQRTDALGAGRAQVLVKARHLINNDTVFQRTGGFIDYVQLLFDEHHIIYAEGISAESQLIDQRTRHALPLDCVHTEDRLSEIEVPEGNLPPGDRADALRRASAPRRQ